MALGYCTTCNRLVSIRCGKPARVDRRWDWYPVPHEADGKLCDGDKRAIR